MSRAESVPATEVRQKPAQHPFLRKPIAVLTDVSFAFPGAAQNAICDVSVTIFEGDRIWLSGDNGSGKSTLLRLLAGLLQPTAGSIVWPDASPSVSMVFQEPENQIVGETVGNDLVLALENNAVSRDVIGNRLKATAESFQIGHLLKKGTGTLSGGETQKVVIAGATIDDQLLLLLDEPDSYLDVEGRLALQDALNLRAKLRPQMAEIRASHAELPEGIYTRRLVLRDGRITHDSDEGSYFQISEEHSSTRTSTALPFLPTTVNVRIVSEGLCFAHRDSASVLRFPDVCLEKGKVIGLSGPTGSGKTTMGMLLCGLLRPNSGMVRIFRDGVLSETKLPEPRVITMLFQQPERQFFLGTCHEELEYAPLNYSMELATHDVRSLMSLVDLSESFLNREPRTLSMGERRRLAFACAMTLRPEHVIFDEPTAGLDRLGKAMFLRLSKDLASFGVGQLVISHDERLLETLCQQIVRLPANSVVSERN